MNKKTAFSFVLLKAVIIITLLELRLFDQISFRAYFTIRDKLYTHNKLSLRYIYGQLHCNRPINTKIVISVF